jgi:hypothetical protein
VNICPPCRGTGVQGGWVAVDAFKDARCVECHGAGELDDDAYDRYWSWFEGKLAEHQRSGSKVYGSWWVRTPQAEPLGPVQRLHGGAEAA